MANTNDYARKKFEVGKIYEAHGSYGSKSYYLVLKRAPSGYITFQQIYPATGDIGERLARKPLKGWESADERVTIQKGTYGRVCWTGGLTLYARDQVKNLPKKG